MKVLVTGSQGYVGSAVISELVEWYPDSIFYGLDLGLFHHLGQYNDLSSDLKFRSVTFQNFNEISENDLKSMDAIIHLAAISNDPMGTEFQSLTNQVNFLDVIKFAKLAKNAGVKKFIFASSASVYGFTDEICKETNKLNPQTAYAESKANSEAELEKLADGNFKITSLRFATAAGWGKRLRMDLVLNQFVRDALFKGIINMNSDGHASRPIIYVKDMAKGIGFCLSDNRNNFKNFEIFNIGQNSWNFEIIELADLVVKNFENKKVRIEKGKSADTRSYRLNFDKFNESAKEYSIKTDINNTIYELISELKRISNLEIQSYLNETIRLTSLKKNIYNFKIGILK